MFDKIKHRLKKKKNLSQLARVGRNPSFGDRCVIIGGENIFVGDSFSAQDNLRLQTWECYRGEKTGYKPSLIIGNDVVMMSNCQISCLNEIIIGDGCLLGDNVFIADNSHGDNSKDSFFTMPIDRKLFSKGPIKIGKNVWIGRNVCVMPNVSIGDNVIVGANSVVTHSFPSDVTIAGAPAKIIKRID